MPLASMRKLPLASMRERGVFLLFCLGLGPRALLFVPRLPVRHVARLLPRRRLS